MADVKSLTLVHLNRQDSVNDNKIAIYVVNIQPLAIVGHHLSCFIMDGTQSLGSGATMILTSKIRIILAHQRYQFVEILINRHRAGQDTVAGRVLLERNTWSVRPNAVGSRGL